MIAVCPRWWQGVFIPDYTQCRPLRGGHTIYMARKCAEINILRFALRPALNPVYAGKHRGSFRGADYCHEWQKLTAG